MRYFIIIFMMVFVGCGSSGEEPSSPTPSENTTGCVFERGVALPENLLGDYQLAEAMTYEDGVLTEQEEATPDKTAFLSLTEEEGATGVFVQSTLTTEETTQAIGRSTLEGDSQLAVFVEESNIPYVYEGATYCLGLEQGKDSITIILDVSSDLSFYYRFSKVIE